VTIGYALLDADQAPRSEVQLGTRAREHSDTTVRRPILCARCASQVTDSSQRIEQAGQHEHTFFNPEGMIYRVACFAAAPGCTGIASFSADFSWFPSYRWQVAICTSCTDHLGWHFAAESAKFSALITERLRELDT
jgi:hypothetical protein